ncbi:MAG TPA: hypothetical protein VEI26_15435 [Terriglobales bacterium]|nr:hypothetical protein [Terriglobales bacterium]
MNGKLLRVRNYSVLSFLLVALCCNTFGQVSIVTQHNDNSRTGQNNAETFLNTSNVNVNSFGKLFTVAVDGSIYAQPLYLTNVTIGGSLHNVVYVATEHNSVYAIDTDDLNGNTLWHVNLGPSVPSNDICGSGCYTDLVPEIGITGTPVIDPQRGILYVAVKNKDSDGTYHYRLHALDVTSGAELLSGPAEISTANFGPLLQLNRPGLLLSGGKLYIGFGSHGDTAPWYGWLMEYDASSLAQIAVFSTAPSLASGGSIWGGGQGPVVDSAGNVYVITANGNFNANTGGSDYGDSFLKLDGTNLSVLDYFTPDNQSFLSQQDSDLGAGGPMLIPGTSLLLGGGKDGILRLVDSTNMGKFNSSFNGDVQEWQAFSEPIMGGPVYWNSQKLGPVAFTWGGGQTLQAWSFNGQTFLTSPASQSTVQSADGYSNFAPMSISSNGNTQGTGIVWAATSLNGNANDGTVPGQLWAFDADDLTQELWDTQQNAARDGAGNFAKFNPPTIANGKVFLPTFSNELLVYGLFNPPGFSITASPSFQSITGGNSASYIVYLNPQPGFSGTVYLTCSGLPSASACSPVAISVPGTGTQVSTPLTVTTSASTPTGNFDFTITGNFGSLAQTTAASLTVTAAPTPTPSFSMAATPLAPATISAGSSATTTVTIAPSGGFNSTVNLGCAIAPVTAVPPTCGLSSASITGGNGTSTLTVSTVAPVAFIPSKQAMGFYYAMLLPFCGLTFIAGSRPARAKLLRWSLGLLMLSTLFWFAACGGGSSTNNGGSGTTHQSTPGTTSGSYTVTVTATGGSLTKTTSLSLTVQ